MKRSLVLAGLVLAIVATPAHAGTKLPTKPQVEDAIHDAIETELFSEYAMPSTVAVHCIRGSRGDRTRLVRWFCIVRTYTPNGDLIYRVRLRARAHRGSVQTTVTFWGAGVIDMSPDPRGWFLTTSKMTKPRRGDVTITGLDGSYVARRLAPILDHQARKNHPGRVALTTLACEGYDAIPSADCTLRVWGPRRHGHRALLERVYILVTRVRYHHPVVFEDYSGWVTTRQPDGRRRSLTLDPETT